MSKTYYGGRPVEGWGQPKPRPPYFDIIALGTLGLFAIIAFVGYMTLALCLTIGSLALWGVIELALRARRWRGARQ
jgi:hypothetical protein